MKRLIQKTMKLDSLCGLCSLSALVSKIVVTTAVTTLLFVTSAFAASYEVRGKTKQQVKAIYGEPISIKGPIGGYNEKRPPITEWDYGNFYITFERNIALHGNERDSLRIILN